jgi:DNA-3-methyladenine glycosylase I
MTRSAGQKSSTRCPWCGTDPLYVAYHDEEWGVPITDDASLFEKLILDGFQAGLSWITILRKRESFRKAFHQFDPARIARYTERDVERLLANEGIIRSRLKIEGAIKNAKLYLEIMKGGEGSFRDYLWKHVNHATRVNRLRLMSDCPAATEESTAMAKELKKRGFTFCGPTICYAFMQAVGMVNDHLVDCPRHAACERIARRR